MSLKGLDKVMKLFLTNNTHWGIASDIYEYVTNTLLASLLNLNSCFVHQNCPFGGEAAVCAAFLHGMAYFHGETLAACPSGLSRSDWG